MPKKTVYKFVDVNHGKLESFGIAGDWCVEYRPGMKVYPTIKPSYLYAFKDLESACDYTSLDGYMPELLQLWVATAEVVEETDIRIEANFGFEMKEFWKAYFEEGERPFYKLYVPAASGTVFCEWIILERLITREEFKNVKASLG